MKTIKKALRMCIPALCVLALFAGPAAAFIVDGDFSASADSAALRTNGTGQDWYESRNATPSTLLYLDTTNVGLTNDTKKAGFTSSTATNAYSTQEFSTPITGTFTAQWQIYVESITNISGTDRTGWMMIGDNSVNTGTDAGRGPNSTAAERFVYMAFYKSGGGSTGSMDLVAKTRDDADFAAQTVVASGLSLDTWYTIKVVCNLATDTYDLYVNDIFKQTVISGALKDSVTDISFAQFNDGAGAFFVDNVSVVPIPGAVWLLGSGLVGLVVIRRRTKK